MLKKGHILRTKDGKTEIEPQLKQILDAAISPPERNRDLVIWIHGGLVDQNSAYAQFPAISDSLEAQGMFPIFLAWQSGIATALPDALSALLLRKIGEHGIDLLAKLLQAKLSFPGLPRFPAASMNKELNNDDRRAIEDAVKASEALMNEQLFLFEGGGKQGPTDLMSLHLARSERDRATREYSDQNTAINQRLIEVGHSKPEGKGFNLELGVAVILAKVATAVLLRYKNGRQHDLRSTIIEEFSRIVELPGEVWSDMKRDAEAHFQPKGAGLELLGVVGQILGENPDRQVYVVGHSTGGVMINKLLTIPDLPVKKFHVRLLASAARMDETAKALSSKENTVQSIRSFMLDPTDEAEALLLSEWDTSFRKDWLNPLYKGSLLYYASGALEPPTGDVPLAGMNRFTSEPAFLTESEKQTVQAFTASVRKLDPNGLVIANTSDAPVGYRSGARKHGDFSGDLQTLESVIK